MADAGVPQKNVVSRSVVRFALDLPWSVALKTSLRSTQSKSRNLGPSE